MQCPYFGICGGCSTQHVPYEQQVQNKQERLAQLLGVAKETIQVKTDKPFQYRNRMDFGVHPKGIGLRKKGDWKHIVDIQQCPISNKVINTLMQEVRNFFSFDAFDPITQKGIYKYVTIRACTTSSITFILNQDEDCQAAQKEIELFAQQTTADNILIGYVGKKEDMSISQEVSIIKGTDMLTQNIAGKMLWFHSQAFFQNNTVMAEHMVKHMQEKLSDKKGTLLDLYGGVGTFGITCGASFSKTIIAEAVRQAIDAAQKNIQQNNAANTTAIVLDAKAVNKIEDIDYCICDPPRSGMHQKAIERLLEKRPKKIMYISCNPKQLANELRRFTKKYTLTSTALFDLFPQTNHMEAIVELDA